jgi:Domain of unknown function (DUF4105)
MNLPITPESQPKTAARLRGVLRGLGLTALGCLLLLQTLWAVVALYFDVRVPWMRAPLATAYGAAVLAVWFFVKRRWLAAGLTAGGFALITAWWLSLTPSNDRDWQPDVAVLPYADIAGNQVTIHNIRNCDYRTETDFDVRHYDKTFNLDELRTVDLFLVTWGSPHIAHTMMSFGFLNGDHVCFSIETRKEKGESYSAVKGLFRQFELTYIIGDERDLVRLRTNYRQGEQVWLYRVQMTPEQGRTFFLDYLKRANALCQRPEWYNALTDNCTIAVRTQRAAADRQPWDWRMLVNGHLDELLYERGTIATNLPFAELKRRSLVNAWAKAADKDPDFSKCIRQNLP